MSGLVDRLVDVEIGLSLLHRTIPPQEYRAEGRPLEWVRPVRERLQREEDAGAQGPANVAAGGDTSGGGSDERHSDWQMDLVDQCVRRIIGGMRDWAALVGMSEEGRNVLRRFGEIRLDLLAVQSALRAKEGMKALAIDDCRIYLRMFAYSLERLSSPGDPRPTVTAYLSKPGQSFASGSKLHEMMDTDLTLHLAMKVLDHQRKSSLRSIN